MDKCLMLVSYISQKWDKCCLLQSHWTLLLLFLSTFFDSHQHFQDRMNANMKMCELFTETKGQNVLRWYGDRFDFVTGAEERLLGVLDFCYCDNHHQQIALFWNSITEEI